MLKIKIAQQCFSQESEVLCNEKMQVKTKTVLKKCSEKPFCHPTNQARIQKC